MRPLKPADSVALRRALAKSFVEDMTWPIDRGSLAALAEMGLTPEDIARYFAIEPREVRAYLARL